MREPIDTRLGRRKFLQLALAAPVLRVAPQSRQASGSRIHFVTFDEAEPIVKSGRVMLPQNLASLGPDAMRAAWPQWVRDRDVEIRNRLQRGEEDTLANFVLFGVSFTNQPRVTPDLKDPDEMDRRIRARAQALADAVAAPGNNERLKLLAGLIMRLGYSAAPGEPRERLDEYVMENINRYMSESQRYRSTVDQLTRNDRSPISVSSETLYKDRGLSIDTDFRPSYAIDTALAEAKRRGLLRSVRRMAIIGPGLDFTDKDSGLDYYPLQTLQPFGVVDSLVRLGLSTIRNLHVSVFEISEATLDHISQSVARARAQQSYTLQLVMDRSRPWNQGSLDYWQRFASAIGTNVAPMALPPQVQNANTRAVRIRPEVVALMEPLSVNAVLQRLDLPSDQRYDLVICTNVLVYYDAFQQALTLSNIESMLAPGGVFLTNDLAEEFPGVRLRPAGLVRTTYSRDQEDQVQIYTRSTFQLQLPPN
jgi:hypothetical protein